MVSLTRSKKICYAIGGIPQKMTDGIIGFFFHFFLIRVVRLSPLETMFVVFAGHLWDALTDPLVGWAITKTPLTKYGQLTLWLFVSTPFAAVTFMLLWLPNISMLPLLYYIVMTCLFHTCQTAFQIPYLTFIMSLSEDETERDSISIYRAVAEILGMAFGVTLQTVIVGKPVACNATIIQTPDFNYFYSGIAVMLIYFCCGAILVTSLKKDYTTPIPLGFYAYRLILSYTPYTSLILSVLFTTVAFLNMQNLFVLFCNTTPSLQTSCQNFILVLISSSLLSLPLWYLIIQRFGKNTTFYLGNTLMILVVFPVLFTIPSLSLTYVIMVGAGAGGAVALLLPWAMLPRVIESFLTRYPNTNYKVLFFSIYILLIKVSVGFLMGISTAALQAAGYKQNDCTQPPHVHLLLRMLLSLFPIISITIGLIYFFATSKLRSFESEIAGIEQL